MMIFVLGRYQTTQSVYVNYSKLCALTNGELDPTKFEASGSNLQMFTLDIQKVRIMIALRARFLASIKLRS